MLLRTKTNKQLREALKNLPKDLFMSYDRILLGIDDESQNLAVRALAWLLTSIRPMELPALVEALAITEGASILDLDSTVNVGLDLVRICGSLVQYNHVNNSVCLSHATVKVGIFSPLIFKAHIC